jgi:hypothetical protein
MLQSAQSRGQETRKFVAEAHKRAAEAHEPAAEIGKTGRPNGILGLQVLVVAGMIAGAALVGVAVVLIKVFRP